MKFDDTIYTNILSLESSIVSLNVLVLFNLFLFLFVKWNKIHPNLEMNIFIEARNKSVVIMAVLFVLLVSVFFLGFTMPEVEGERGTPSPIYEYSLVFFIVYFYFCGLEKKYVFRGLLLVSLFSIQNFVFGGRIMGIQFLLCAYVMLYMHRIKMPFVLGGLAAAFFLMSIVGVVRGALLSGDIDVNSILSSLFLRGFALDTAYSAYFTSESFVYAIDKLSVNEIWNLFLEFVKSIFVGGNADMQLPSVSRFYVTHYGGGLIPFYFYFYLDGIGVLLAASIVSFYMNLIVNLHNYSTGYAKCLTVWIVSTTFRWYLYTPIGLLRGVLLFTIVYYSFIYFHYQLKRLPIRNNQTSFDNKEQLGS